MSGGRATDPATGDAGAQPAGTEGTAAQELARPLLQVVSPDATPEEIAALVAVLSSLGGGEAPARPPRSVWSHPARGVRRTLPHGRGGWRASGLL